MSGLFRLSINAFQDAGPILLTPLSAFSKAVKDEVILETQFKVDLLSIAGGAQPNCHYVVSPWLTTSREGANQSCSCRNSEESSRKRVIQNGLPTR